MLHQERRTRRGRRRYFHRPARHSSLQLFFRRFRKIRRGPSRESPDARSDLNLKSGEAMISGTSASEGKRRIRLGMVGGGPGAFIGAVHRIAARMDDHYELVAAALSSDQDPAGPRRRTCISRLVAPMGAIAKSRAPKPL